MGDFVEMCACGAEECLAGERPAGGPPPCETRLSHVFLHCPVVKPAVEWLRGLWARLGNGPPPLDAQADTQAVADQVAGCKDRGTCTCKVPLSRTASTPRLSQRASKSSDSSRTRLSSTLLP